MCITTYAFASSSISIVLLNYFLCIEYLSSNKKFKRRASTKVSLRVVLMQVNIWKLIYLNCGEKYEDTIVRRIYTQLLTTIWQLRWFLTFASRILSAHNLWRRLRSFHWNRTYTKIFVKLCLLIFYIIGT